MSSNSLDIYRREIADIPLLSEKDERETYENINSEAKEKLIKANLRLVVKIAGSFQNMGLDIEDLISEGNIGLALSANKFDANKGAKFSTYAAIWIKKYIRKALCEKSRTIRIPNNSVEKFLKIREFCNQYRQENDELEPTLKLLSEKFGLSTHRIKNIFAVCDIPLSLNFKSEDSEGEGQELGDELEDFNASSAYESIQSKEDWRLAMRAIERLSCDQRLIISRRFGLFGNKQETLVEVGKRFKVSREQIRKEEVYLLTKMRQIME
jgi:RNA polymerase primary sigma factor